MSRIKIERAYDLPEHRSRYNSEHPFALRTGLISCPTIRLSPQELLDLQEDIQALLDGDATNP